MQHTRASSLPHLGSLSASYGFIWFTILEMVEKTENKTKQSQKHLVSTLSPGAGWAELGAKGSRTREVRASIHWWRGWQWRRCQRTRSGPREKKYVGTYSYTWEADAKTLTTARFKLCSSTITRRAGIGKEGRYTCLASLTGCC